MSKFNEVSRCHADFCFSSTIVVTCVEHQLLK